ncbi:undecaprenyl-phosphate galactose phosphotransferase WbaP [Escherichia coli]|uniref:undecaprenyl-phosphate galactose phosphotransferase WbaP n=1 Tax=Escherichia coli TaxID=562 RepID=UPI003FD6432A
MTSLTKNIWTSLFLAISDFVSFVLSMYIALGIFFVTLDNYKTQIPKSQIEDWKVLHVMLGFICVAWFGARLRHYFYRKTFWFELKEILRTLVIFAVIEIAVMAFSQWSFSRYLWVLTWVFALLLVPLFRISVKILLDKINIWQRDTVIIGNGKNAYEAWSAINSEKNLGLKIIKFIACDERFDIKNINGIPVCKVNKECLHGFDKRTQFIIALESDQIEIRNSWLRELMIKNYRYVSVIPTLRGVPLDSTDMSFIFSHEVMIFRVHNNLAKWSSRLIKRLFDILGALSIIVMLSPVLLYIAFNVRKDGGNVIYGHERIGKGGKTFKCLKFRSMVVNSKEVLQSLLENDPVAREEWRSTFKLKNDPRITKVGSFLRRTSLDELPQLFNVLRGEMSLVGPRPVIKDELERYSEHVDYYLLSKPGMTGLWQVSGRSDVDYDTRIYLDTWYVKNWSLWNDIVILFKTINVVLRKDGAY